MLKWLALLLGCSVLFEAHMQLVINMLADLLQLKLHYLV